MSLVGPSSRHLAMLPVMDTGSVMSRSSRRDYWQRAYPRNQRARGAEKQCIWDALNRSRNWTAWYMAPSSCHTSRTCRWCVGRGKMARPWPVGAPGSANLRIWLPIALRRRPGVSYGPGPEIDNENLGLEVAVVSLLLTDLSLEHHGKRVEAFELKPESGAAFPVCSAAIRAR